MTKFAILATGPSMSQEIADFVRGKCGVIVVSDAYRLALSASAMVSNDATWWRHNQQALTDFVNPKFCGYTVAGTQKIAYEGALTTGSNSGLVAMFVAVKYFGAKELLLCGFDLGGTHYFGPHPSPLKNTSADRFEVFKRQFISYRPRGIKIWNCTPNSALNVYPKACLEDLLGSDFGVKRASSIDHPMVNRDRSIEPLMPISSAHAAKA